MHPRYPAASATFLLLAATLGVATMEGAALTSGGGTLTGTFQEATNTTVAFVTSTVGVLQGDVEAVVTVLNAVLATAKEGADAALLLASQTALDLTMAVGAILEAELVVVGEAAPLLMLLAENVVFVKQTVEAILIFGIVVPLLMMALRVLGGIRLALNVTAALTQMTHAAANVTANLTGPVASATLELVNATQSVALTLAGPIAAIATVFVNFTSEGGAVVFSATANLTANLTVLARNLAELAQNAASATVNLVGQSTANLTAAAQTLARFTGTLAATLQVPLISASTGVLIDRANDVLANGSAALQGLAEAVNTLVRNLGQIMVDLVEAVPLQARQGPAGVLPAGRTLHGERTGPAGPAWWQQPHAQQADGNCTQVTPGPLPAQSAISKLVEANVTVCVMLGITLMVLGTLATILDIIIKDALVKQKLITNFLEQVIEG